MADSTTAVWGLTKPEPGSSRDTWGAKLNLDWDQVDAIMAALNPIGAVTDFAGAAAPSGWLLCDGTVHPISSYPKLAAVLGATYGGDGVTTFAVPDCRGRVTACVGNATDSGGITTGFTLGAKSGWWSVTLTASNLPPVAVTINSASVSLAGSTDSQGLHAHNGSTDAQGDHAHTYQQAAIPAGLGFAAGVNIAWSPVTANTSTAGSHSHNVTTTNDGSHSHSVSLSGGSHTHTGSIAGSSSPFGVWQPTIAFNKIIFAGPPGHTSLSSPIPGAPALMASPMRGVG